MVRYCWRKRNNSCWTRRYGTQNGKREMIEELKVVCILSLMIVSPLQLCSKGHLMLIKAIKHNVLFVWTVSTPGNSSSNTKMFLPFFNILEGLFPRWPGSAAPWLQLDPLKPSHPHPKWLSFFQSPSHDHPLSLQWRAVLTLAVTVHDLPLPHARTLV